MNIYILGAGTLAGFIADIIRRIPDIEVAGQFDDRYPSLTQSNGLPVIGRLEDTKPGMSLALGVGAPTVRKEHYLAKIAQGCSFPVVVDPSCVISSAASLEDGVIIGPLSSVLSGSTIHRGACLLSHVNVNQDVTVGAFCLIGASSSIGNGANVGEGSHIGLGGRISLGMTIESWSDVSQI